MKKITIPVLLLLLMLLFVGCGNKTIKGFDTLNNAANNSEDIKNDIDDISVETFLKKVDGYWICQNSDRNMDVLEFKNARMTDYTYSGHIWLNEGRIKDITKLSSGELEAIISYNEIVYGVENDSPEEKETKYIFKTDDDYRRTLIVVWQDEEYTYTYLGANQEDVDNYITKNIWSNEETPVEKENYSVQQNTSHIPVLSSSSKCLGKDIETLKILRGDFFGPLDNYRSFATNWLYLKNLNEVNCYKSNTAQPHELLGIDGDVVVFWGMFGTASYAYVKDFLDDEELMVEPAVYSINNGAREAFVWKIENGFLVIYAVPVSSAKWYKRPAEGMVHVRDIKYLSFVD